MRCSMRRGVADHWSAAARRRGYPSRALFKLEEVDRRHRLLRPGQSVIDLGAVRTQRTQRTQLGIAEGGVAC